MDDIFVIRFLCVCDEQNGKWLLYIKFERHWDWNQRFRSLSLSPGRYLTQESTMCPVPGHIPIAV